MFQSCFEHTLGGRTALLFTVDDQISLEVLNCFNAYHTLQLHNYLT